MKKSVNLFSVPVIVLCIIFALNTGAAAAGVGYTSKEHNLSITLPEDYNLITADNASKNSEVISDFGYTTASFKSYLKQNQLLFFASDQKRSVQVTLKAWADTQNDSFSQQVEDFSLLSDDTVLGLAKQLFKVQNASCKVVLINSMRFIEARSTSSDSGGKFSSVQYLTVRNKNFYALTVLSSGDLSDSSVEQAWNIAQTLSIKNKTARYMFGVSSFVEAVLIWLLILAAAVTVILIIISFIRDYKRHCEQAENETHIIARRKM